MDVRAGVSTNSMEIWRQAGGGGGGGGRGERAGAVAELQLQQVVPIDDITR